MRSASPSGRQVTLVHGNHQAVVVEVGGGLRTYQVGGDAVIDGYAEGEMCASGRGQVLAPWPNRLDGGRYEWEGRRLQLALSEPSTSCASHGLVRWAPWRVAAAGTSWATMAYRLPAHPGYPWTLDLSVTYALSGPGLTVVTEAVNRSEEPAPFGLGFHPYLHAFGGLVDSCSLQAPARTVYTLDGRNLPAATLDVAGTPADWREGRAVRDQILDTPYTDLIRDRDGMARIALGAADGSRSTTVWLGAAYTHVQLFTGDTLGDAGRRRRGIAVEPMTGPPNLLASGVDRVRLLPGVPWRAEWGVTPG